MNKLVFFCILSVAWVNSQVKSIVFDLNGVLFFNQRSFLIRRMGILSLLLYTVRYFNNPMKIQHRFFTLLNEAFPCPSGRSPVKARDEKGNILPYIMDAWLDGTFESTTIIPEFKKYLLQNKQLKIVEKKIFYRLCHLIFNPLLFAKSQLVSYDGIKAIKELKKLGYKLYILSNWPSDSFPLIKDKYHELFNLFDGVLISGDCHMNKPDPGIYQQLLLQFKLFPQETVFIDDQAINVIAAQQCGMHAIVCPVKGLLQKRPDFGLIMETIASLNA